MALWFPLMVNRTQIGEVAIIRRDDPISEEGEYTYDWTVQRTDVNVDGKQVTQTQSGELTHCYADGAFELIYKVVGAYRIQELLGELMG